MIYKDGIITIGDIQFDLNELGNDEEAKLLKIRNLAETISLGNEKTVKYFYSGALNKFEFNIKQIDNSIKDKVSELIRDMQVAREQLEEVVDKNFMDFIRTVTVVSKILTGIYVLITVKQSACGSGKNVEILKEDQDKEIKRLRELLSETSTLLFNLDKIDYQD